MCSGVRSGSRRGPRSTQIATVPTSSGTPTRAKEKNGNGPAPASCAASDTITLTGLLISSSNPPQLPAKATGMSSCDGDRPVRWATRTTSGSNAATAPLRVINEVRRAESRQTATSTRAWPVPDRSSSHRPSRVVTPVESMPSLTTKSVAMKMTTGSPNPATASFVVTRPVAQRLSAAPMATIPTGNRFQMNSATTTPSTTRAFVESSNAGH